MEKTPSKRLCPYCSEEIIFSAKKCKHCGEWLDAPRYQRIKQVGIIIFLLLLGFVLFFIFRLDKPRSEALKTSTDTNLFNSKDNTALEMKVKCATYRPEIVKFMEEKSWSKYYIGDIFYSSVKNSCLFSVIGYTDSSAIIKQSFTGYMIWDYLTNNLIFYRDTTLTNGQNITDVYDNAVSYLKGESQLKYSEKDWNTD